MPTHIKCGELPIVNMKQLAQILSVVANYLILLNCVFSLIKPPKLNKKKEKTIGIVFFLK